VRADSAPGRATEVAPLTAPRLTFDDLVTEARAARPADRRVRYGAHALAFGDLWLAERRDGPAPLVVYFHGGCWLARYDLGHACATAAALADEGYGVWLPEYRRLGDDGGGWPGTFEDVAQAIDHVRTIGVAEPSIDARRVVLAGHSAGGQLALWAATRSPVVGVLGLAAISDLETYGAAAGSCNASVTPLLGGTPAEFPDRYRTFSPVERIPLGVRTVLVHGGDDAIVPVEMSEAYGAKARGAGESVEVKIVPGAGHYDLVSPRAGAWAIVVRALQSLFA
jgi:acetyl esterase/lipase